MLITKAFCHACGASTVAGALFCEACGIKLNANPISSVDVGPLKATLPTSNVQTSQVYAPNSVHPDPFQQTVSQTARGRILRDTNNGIGLLSVGDRQVPFSLEANWRGNIAPAIQMHVDIALDDTGNVVSVMPISDKDIAQEKLKVLSTGLTSKIQEHIPLMKSYASAIGTPILVAISLLFISWIWLSLISVRVSASVSQSVTMFDALGFINMGGNLESFGQRSSGSSGLYGLVCVLAMLAPLVPTFVKHRYSNLCYFAPLIFSLIFSVVAFLKLRSYANAARESMGAFGNSAQMNNMMNAMMDQIMAAVSIGMGAYLSIALALYLAGHGAIKLLANR